MQCKNLSQCTQENNIRVSENKLFGTKNVKKNMDRRSSSTTQDITATRRCQDVEHHLHHKNKIILSK